MKICWIIILASVFSVAGCSQDNQVHEKPMADIDKLVIVNREIESNLTALKCTELIELNISKLAFKFNSNSNGIFVFENGSWKSHIQCLDLSIIFNVQGKNSIPEEQKRLTKNEALEMANQLSSSLNQIVHKPATF